MHVAIIMDGNGRWAEHRHLPRVVGHEEGVRAIEKVLKAAIKHKISVLTLFAFGIENWGRPAQEVNFLMRLFVKNLESQTERFIKNNIQLRVIGDRTRISEKLRDKIQQVEDLTAKNTGLVLIIAFNYSGRWDILQATQKLGHAVLEGTLSPSKIDYNDIQSALSFSDLPDPDLFIRTSGEQRVSNFLLWQFAYTEFYFTDILWPDFDEKAFEDALHTFSLRQRRYGLTGQQAMERERRALQ